MLHKLEFSPYRDISLFLCSSPSSCVPLPLPMLLSLSFSLSSFLSFFLSVCHTHTHRLLLNPPCALAISYLCIIIHFYAGSFDVYRHVPVYWYVCSCWSGR